MSNRTLNRALRRSALTVALGFCFASTVHAQSSSGSVFGQAVAGQQVLIENPATGIRRQLTVSDDGAFRAVGLPPGTYRVSVTAADGTSVVRDAVVVNAGAGTSVNFRETAVSGSPSDATTLDAVQVLATRAINPIDVSSVDSTTILTAAQIARIPVPRDGTSVALLAPGTVRGDSAFGNLASFGGASVAENQYYLNGFNITNSFAGLNFAQVPFEAIAEQQTKTGGYGAEFGRSLGGVVNQITKRGTNDFHAGGNVFYTPSAWTATRRDVYLPNGVLRSDNSHDEPQEVLTGAVWASGALIKDRLFAYGLIQYSKTDESNLLAEGNFGRVGSTNNTSRSTKAPNYLLKLDWNINDSNLLEFTTFSDKRKEEIASYTNDAGQFQRTGYAGTNFLEEGGANYLAKYTGFYTDTFTLSALYGHSTYSRSQYLVTANGTRVEYSGDLDNPATGCPTIVDVRTAETQGARGGLYESSCNLGAGNVQRKDAEDTRDQFRIDADWQLGNHALRFGFDYDTYESVAGTSLEGGRTWRYSTVGAIPGVPGSGFDVVREQITNQGATVKVDQTAFYVQDSWSVSDNVLLVGGLRWDSFKNLNGDGDAYVDIKNQFGPRLGFSWDVNGDSSLKVYGNAGRYALPLTPTVAIRGASASLFTRQQFTFTGVDPVTGAPIGIAPRTGPTGALQFINGENGESKNPATITDKNLEPMYQDEYIMGIEQMIGSHFRVGMRGIYRELKAAIDDTCDYVPIFDQAVAQGLDPVIPNGGFPYCRIFNPGSSPTFVTDVEGDGVLREYVVDGALLSPQARRTYSALEFSADATFDNWFVSANYTYAKSKGNTEGGVKSDNGQADTNTTQDFDYLVLTTDTYGYLPNDRRHTLKVFGNYEFNEEWSIGANLLVQSGRPLNCFGVLNLDDSGIPANAVFQAYGSSFQRCGTTAEFGGAGPSVAVPRGTAGRLPWTNTLDLNVAYAPGWVEGLKFKVDVFNVFNRQDSTSVSETAEDGATGARLETYRQPLSYQLPRSVRMMVQYDF